MFRRIILPNGLRFIHVPVKGTQTVTVLVMAATGSKYEAKEKNGISHFLEHMMFKGTRRRPKPADIREELDGVGANYNAFTAHEWTGYFVKVPREHTRLAVDIVSDMLLHALFKSTEIDRERGAVIAELNMYRDDPMRHVEDLYYEVLYGDQPVGWNVGGRPEVIRRIRRQDFLRYLRDHYRAESMAVVIAGNIGEAEALRLVKKYFTAVRKGKGKGKLPVVIRQSQPEVKITSYPHADQGHVRLGIHAYDIFHPDRYAFGLFVNILGGSTSSRLWNEIREKRGLAYYVRAAMDQMTDAGSLAIAAGIHLDRLVEGIRLILGELGKLREKGVTKKELKLAKNLAKGRLAMDLEETNEVAFFVGGEEIITQKPLTMKEVFAKIDAVGVEDVNRVARDIIRPRNFNLALTGPFDAKKDVERFRKLLKL